MSNYSLEPFRPEHVWEMQFRAHDNDDMFVALRRRAAATFARFPGFTGRYQGRIVGAAGIVCPLPGVGEAWAMATTLVYEHRVFFHRTIKRMMRVVVDNLGLHRLQACVLANYAEGHRWIEALGFKYDATLRKYGPNGEDFYVYAIYPQETAE